VFRRYREVRLKALIVGGGGQVARALASSVPSRIIATTMTRAQLDISDMAAVERALERTEANWLINAAAYTAVDLAEDHADQARATNETAVGILARATSLAKCRLLHLSTDFVFNGHSNRAYLPRDATGPLSVYGVTKLGGELQAMMAHSSVVLRTSWVYSSQGRNFVLTMLRLMKELPEVRVVCDQIGAPTSSASVARAIWALISVAAPSGIYHWTDLGVASWYDFAVAIQEEALARGLLSRTISVIPIRSSEYPTKACRPAFSVLNTESTRYLVETPAAHWRTNLRVMLDELRTQ
jgi:dTDP-4-dehydrorhamnose reductase